MYLLCVCTHVQMPWPVAPTKVRGPGVLSFYYVGPRVEPQWSGLITYTYSLGCFCFQTYLSCLSFLGPRTSRRAGVLPCRTQGLSAPSLRDKESLAGKVGGVGRRAWESASSRKFQHIKMPAPG